MIEGGALNITNKWENLLISFTVYSMAYVTIISLECLILKTISLVFNLHNRARAYHQAKCAALVVIALFVFGGKMVHNFALALIIGIVVGTYV